MSWKTCMGVLEYAPGEFATWRLSCHLFAERRSRPRYHFPMKSALLIFCFATHAWASENCADLCRQAEEATGKTAQEKALAAIKVCAGAKVKSARPQMVLATEEFRAGRYQKAVHWAQEGLKQEPGLALAHMNMCAALERMKKYPDAIAACERGLKAENPWTAKLEFNLGKAKFSQAVESEKFSEALKAEPHFLKSMKIDPDIPDNFYFMGVLEFGVRGDASKSAGWHHQACARGHEGACKEEGKMKAQVLHDKTAGAVPQPAETASSSAEEAELWARIKQNYIKKGVKPAAAESTVQQMKGHLTGVPTDQRLNIILQMEKGSR